MDPANYFLGAPEPSWLNKGDGVPKFVSAPRLDRYRTGGERWPIGSQSRYALDSGAFMALNAGNDSVPFFLDDDTYGGRIARWVDDSGYPPDFCAPRDVPCEPTVLKRTGLTVDDHQDLSTDSFIWLEREFPWLPWIPVLQGWQPADYLRHRRKYEDRGIDLTGYHRVGVGSICRRAHLPQIVAVIEQFADAGIKMHGFGVKTTALPLIGHLLTSADSMAWSKDARHNPRLPDCTHGGKNCANCYRYAVAWRDRVIKLLTPAPETAPSGRRADDNGIEKETIVSTATIQPGLKKPTGQEAAASDAEAAAVFAALIAAPKPKPEPEPWKGVGPEPIDGVDLREVALGTFGKVYGTLPSGRETCAAGYVVEVSEVVKNYEGWTPEDGLVVLLAGHPDALDGLAVWVGRGEQQMTVCRPPKGRPEQEVTAAPYTATPVGQLVERAVAQLDLAVTSPDSSSFEVAGVDRSFTGVDDIAAYLFGPSPFWRHRTAATPRQRLIDAAVAEGKLKGDRLCGRMPLRQVNCGAWVRVTGEVSSLLHGKLGDGVTTIEGQLLRWYTENHGNKRKGPVNISLRIDYPQSIGPDGKIVVSVAVPADKPVYVEVIDQHADAAAASAPLTAGTVLPVGEVPWGTYGRLSGYHPDGSPARNFEGYMVGSPRLFTGGIMGKPKLCGPDNPLLHFDFLAFREVTKGGGKTSCYMGFHAQIGATFTVLAAPAEYPLPGGDGDGYGMLLDYKRSNRRSCRMPCRDLRAGDLVGDGELGMPIRSGRTTLLLGDPKPLADDRVELLIEQDGVVRTYGVKGDEYVTVKAGVPYTPEHLELRAWPAEPKGRTPLMPAVRRAKSNTTGFAVSCMVNTCLSIWDGWTTARGAEVGWRRHVAEAHEADGYVAVWDFDTWPMESPINYRRPGQVDDAKVNRSNVEVIPPKDDPSWEHIADLMSHRMTDLGQRGVRVDFDTPAQAREFGKALVAGGLPPSLVVVNLPDKPGKPLSAKAKAALQAMADKAGVVADSLPPGPQQLTIDAFLAAWEAEQVKS